jgi:hypothetical protein
MQAVVARGRTQHDGLRTLVPQLLAPIPNLVTFCRACLGSRPPALVPPLGPQEARPEARFFVDLAPAAGCTVIIALP